MRRISLLVALVTCYVTAHAQLQDNFSDGDFTANPVWVGNTSDFTVVSNQLRSNNSVASSSYYLSTSSAIVNDCQWDFWCNLQFNTSSLNYVDVYLIADQSNLLSTTLNGYFVRIGGTADEVSLFKNTAGTAVKIIDGADGTTNLSNNQLRVKVVRDLSNSFTLSVDYTGSGSSYTVEGSVTDNTFLTSNSFGVAIKQSTASFFLKHFFDDFYAGPIVTDTTAPFISSSTITSANGLDLLFNEDVEITSAQAVSNYVANNGLGNPVSAVRDAGNFALLHLTFATSFANGVQNMLVVNNVEDLFTNQAADTTYFTYYNLSTPLYHDVFITEIMADPNPAAGSLPLVEWVEVYNATANKVFDLSGWTFSDAGSSGTLQSKYLLPGQYIVLCKNADTAALSPFANVCGLSSLPSLNDAGDFISLKDNSGNVIDSLTYNVSWYQNTVKDDGGYSLEKINPNYPASCPVSTNWIATNDVNGGTPGAQNSVYSTAPDVTGPGVLQVSVIDSTHIVVCFSEAPDLNAAVNVNSYSVSSGIGVPTSAVFNSGDYKCIELTLGSALQSSTNYTLSFSSLADCSGNAVSPASITFSFYLAGFNDVVINEIMPDPDPAVNLPNYEYLELHNRTSYDVSLRDYTISTTTTIKTLPDVVIKADSFLVLTGSTAYPLFAAMNIAAAEVSGFPSLTNTGAVLTLRNSAGQVIHTVAYTDDWYRDAAKSEGGFSLEMIDPTNPCAGEENWRASLSANGGTPGYQNAAYAANVDATAPSLLRVSVISADTIQLFFDETVDSTLLKQLSIYAVDNGIGTPVYSLVISTAFKSVKLALAAPLQTGIIYTITVQTQLFDCVGNQLSSDASSARFALPEPAAPGDVIINELLFDPKTGGVDFVELYNNSAKTIDLSQLYLGEQDTVSLQLETEQISTDGFLLFPGEYLVLSESGSIVKSQYFTPSPKSFLDMIDLPAMNTSDDVVVIADQTGVLIDKVVYTDDMHFDLLNETKGVSLERIDFSRSSLDKTNWNSAASTVGYATPGYRNSQYYEVQESGDVVVEPKTFSPDNDGYEDVLNIAYTLEATGQIGNVNIFDASGRLVRRLLRSETLSLKGTVSWNGLTDSGDKAAIGIYVIYFESIETSGKVHKFKRSCVLAGRL